MHELEEHLPSQNSNEYIEKQKEIYNDPLHKSGLELTSSIANITSEALLITQENLNYTPEVFSKHTFQKKREHILEHSEEEREYLLHDLSLNLKKEYKDYLKESIFSFLNNFENYAKVPKYYKPTRYKMVGKEKKQKQREIIKNKLSKCHKKVEDRDYKELKDTLFLLLKDEIDIQNAFETYMDLAFFLYDNGVDICIFEEIINMKEFEKKKKYTTH